LAHLQLLARHGKFAQHRNSRKFSDGFDGIADWQRSFAGFVLYFGRRGIYFGDCVVGVDVYELKNMSKKILKNKPQREPEVEKWIAQEVIEQQARYKKIAQEMNIDLAEQREVWIQEFYERIQTTGFYWHADNKKIIKPDEIFQKPDREFKVVF